MENLDDYINVFVQAPMAVILMYFIFRMFKLFSDFCKDIIKMIKKE